MPVDEENVKREKPDQAKEDRHGIPVKVARWGNGFQPQDTTAGDLEEEQSQDSRPECASNSAVKDNPLLNQRGCPERCKQSHSEHEKGEPEGVLLL